ncbi:MAG: flagellar biosynthesis anti-sigma factor FlgM [Candidatus Hydrogenedentes bacterium]|nr:flagellar biosynthesis anti-sigma factor FlgM [Candidatus Hydrogenedentota bacterium]
MVGIQGLGGIPEPAPDRPSNVKDRRRDDSQTTVGKDDVLISSEAQAAARLQQLVQVAKQEPDVRNERVEAARQALEQGNYKKPEVVEAVAKKLSQLLG